MFLETIVVSEQLTQPPGRGRDEGSIKGAGTERGFRSFVVPTLGRLSTIKNRTGPNNQIVVFLILNKPNRIPTIQPRTCNELK